MGCDIHLFVEKRRHGEWEAINGLNPDLVLNEEYRLRYIGRGDYHAAESLSLRMESRAAAELWVLDWLYPHRNYDVFAILAGVRNGRGFAGIKTGDGFIPIAEPKGLPKDMSALVQRESERWGLDGHSHSHLTLKELQDYDWDQETVTEYYGRCTYRKCAQSFLEQLPKLEWLCVDDPESVRIVFWFDN